MKAIGVGILVVVVGFVIISSGDDEQVIGGDREEHGCLVGAGYSWNEGELSCIREWESGEGRYQVTSFVRCEAAGYDVMESFPR